jgi:hypothetical protein
MDVDHGLVSVPQGQARTKADVRNQCGIPFPRASSSQSIGIAEAIQYGKQYQHISACGCWPNTFKFSGYLNSDQKHFLSHHRKEIFLTAV